MKREEKSGILIILFLICAFQIAFTFTSFSAISETYLADQIHGYLSKVTSWNNLENIGLVMHQSALNDFDTWITRKADVHDWVGVFSVKRYAEQCGYSSGTIDTKLKLALSNIPMFKNYSLPITEVTDAGYFWPWDRYVLYGYRYAEELNWEVSRWNKTSGFLALKSVRDWYERAFYKCNPDVPSAQALFGTRWHQSGSLMDCFFIFYKLGVGVALNYSLQEWKWMNNTLWSGDHFSYSPSWPNWEFSGISVFPNVAKLHLKGTYLDNWDRATIDLQFRYVSSLWNSLQWHETSKVVEHHHPDNAQKRLDGTLDAWLMLNTFYGVFNSQNRINMMKMLEGSEVTQAWIGLNEFMETFSHISESLAQAALCLFLLGISPQDGRGLAIPLVSDRHSCYASLNYRHFEFDYTNHMIKIPVWGETTLKFMYGNTPVTKYFEKTGIYKITFNSNWNSIFQVIKVSNLYPNEYYVWTQEDSISSPITILSPENKTYTTTSVPLKFSLNKTVSWIGYCLDNQANITIIGNTTLIEMVDGPHDLTVYANDIVGNTITSNTIHFTINTRQQERTMLIITIIAVITGFSLIYFRSFWKKYKLPLSYFAGKFWWGSHPPHHR